MCEADVEHFLHVFFDCPFATQCWKYAGGSFDMQHVEFAPDWLINKLSNASGDDCFLIAKVLWGIWFFRNKRVWENKVVTHTVAMDWSSKFFSDWKKAKESKSKIQKSTMPTRSVHPHKWFPPVAGCVKLNVDASVFPNSDRFSIGLIIRDHGGSFLVGKVLCLT